MDVTNNLFHYIFINLLIKKINYCVYKMSKNSDKVPRHKLTSPNTFFVRSTVPYSKMYDLQIYKTEKNHHIITFEKPELGNIWHFCLT